MAEVVARFSKAVERMPSMVIVYTKQLNIACSHGAIPPNIPKSIVNALDDASTSVRNGDSIPVKLGSSIAHRLEWADYRGARIVSKRKHADALMVALKLHACAGGHQDRIEAFGVLSDRALDSKDWRVSPVYHDKHFYVPRELCGDAPDKCVAPRVYRIVPIEFDQPTIFKTSLAYTGKPSVTGAAFLSTRIPNDAPPEDMRRVYGHVMPRRAAAHRSAEELRLTSRQLFEFALDDWTSLGESLPVLYTTEAIDAYKDSTLRRIDASTLSDVVAAFESVQPDDGDCARIVRDDDADLLLVGDIHSNLHGLLDLLASWVHHGWMTSSLLLVENVCVVFMGDYADRGPYGLLVYSLLFVLKHKNPTRIHLTRGNHERPDFWKHYAQTGGLITELANIRV